MKLVNSVFVIFMLTLLAACGGGGGSTEPSAAPSTAVIKLNLTGTLPSNTAIAGVGITITLPANVTPELANSIVAASVVTPSGTFAGGTQTSPVYSAASGTIQLALVNSADAGVTDVGEVATVTLQLANGVAPTDASFSLASVNVIDTLGNPIAGMGAVVSGVTLQ